MRYGRNDGREVWHVLSHTSSFIILHGSIQALVLKYASAGPEGFTLYESEIPLYGVDVGVAVGVSVGVEVCVAVGVAVKVGVGVEVVVGGAVVGVAVGASELCRAMRGLTQRAKSSCDDPLARTDRMNFTFSPLSVLKSMLIGYA